VAEVRYEQISRAIYPKKILPPVAIVWSSTESRAIRFWAVWAVIGSLVLGIDAVFNSLCGIAENRSELFYERCEGSVPYIPLYAVPLLLAAPILRNYVSGFSLLAMGVLVIAVAMMVPMQLFSV
jgi:hypothetical protein